MNQSTQNQTTAAWIPGQPVRATLTTDLVLYGYVVASDENGLHVEYVRLEALSRDDEPDFDTIVFISWSSIVIAERLKPEYISDESGESTRQERSFGKWEYSLLAPR